MNAQNEPETASALQELRAGRQWIAWWSVVGRGERAQLPNFSLTRVLWPRKKPHKLPINPNTGGLASSTDPTAWVSYEQAREASEKWNLSGVGYVFTKDDPYTGLDLDDCRNPETGEIAPWAAQIIQQIASYTEVSPSKTGVKMWIKGALPQKARHRTELGDGEIEVYSAARYFAFTGQHVEGTPITIEERQAELDKLYGEVFGSSETPERRAPAPVAQAQLVPALAHDDAALIEKARRAKNGAKFARLMGGDTSGYKSHSEADLALCCQLAFWTGRDTIRIDRIFRQSGLYRPDKWERDDYRDMTIARAIENTTEIYMPRHLIAAPQDPPQRMATTSASDAGEIAAAKAVLEGLEARIKADAGAAFAPDVLDALAVIKIHDIAAWTRAKDILRKRGVSLNEIKKEIRPRCPQITEEVVAPEQGKLARRCSRTARHRTLSSRTLISSPRTELSSGSRARHRTAGRQ